MGRRSGGILSTIKKPPSLKICNLPYSIPTRTPSSQWTRATSVLARSCLKYRMVLNGLYSSLRTRCCAANATSPQMKCACLWAIEPWEKFLLGRHFTLGTDYGALLTLLHQHTVTRKSAKFTRWLERLSRFNYTVKHIAGSQNCVADPLSLLPLPLTDGAAAIKNDEPVGLCNVIASLSNGLISVAEIHRHTTTDALLKQVIAYTKSS